MQYRIVDGAEQMKLEDIAALLHLTYWAGQRPVETIEKSVRHSACYGIYVEGDEKLAAFARVISDYATTYYLCDVVVAPQYRGQGLGKALLAHIHALPDYAGLRGLLLTKDAHGLYEKFGFQTVRDRAMSKTP